MPNVLTDTADAVVTALAGGTFTPPLAPVRSFAHWTQPFEVAESAGVRCDVVPVTRLKAELLTRGTVLPSVTRQELLRLAPTEVIVVGGTGVVSSSVQSAIAQAVPKATIRRVAGANRYETAAALARADATIPTIAYVATGANFPDALAAGPVAAHQRGDHEPGRRVAAGRPDDRRDQR